MSKYHIPVLLDEVLDALKIQTGKRYIDATLGGGGHTKAILEKGGIVLGIDQDEASLHYVKETVVQGNQESLGKRLFLAKGNFRDIAKIAHKNGFNEVDGILLDLGVSSHQLQSSERGFSFLRNGPLDMRMDQTLGSASAKDLINGLYKKELVQLFEKYGEENQARRIADAICKQREIKKIETTGELAALIAKVKRRVGKIHPATLVFQALRIAVNDELGSLEKALSSIENLIKPEGRVVVISFHSLEDRVVKNFFQTSFKYKAITSRPIQPTDEELFANPRARSSKLRIYEKLKN